MGLSVKNSILFVDDNAYLFNILASVFYHFVFYKLSVRFMRQNHPVTPPEKPNHHHQTASRVVSTIHAIVATYYSIQVLVHETEYFDNPLSYTSLNLRWTMCNSIGYFIYDFLYMLVHREELTFQYFIHHLVAGYGFQQGVFGSAFLIPASIRLTSEASTPFLNIRWLLLSLKKRFTLSYASNAVILLFVFVACRTLPIAFNWWLVYRGAQTVEWTLMDMHYKVVFLVASLAIDALNVWWSWGMFRKSYRYVVVNKDYLHLRVFGGDGGLTHVKQQKQKQPKTKQN